MSVKCITHYWESEYKGSHKLMLLALADYASEEDGACYPGVSRLAKKCSVSERQAQKILRKLEQDGEIAIDYQSGIETDHGKTNRYTLISYAKHVKGELHDAPNHDGVNSTTPQGVNSTTPKPSVEPSVKNTSSGDDAPADSPATPSPENPKKERKRDPHFDAVCEAWNLTPAASGVIVNYCGMLFHDRKVRGAWNDCKLHKPMDVDELRMWAMYARSDERNKNGLPTVPETIQRQIEEWRAGKHKATFKPMAEKTLDEAMSVWRWS